MPNFTPIREDQLDKIGPQIIPGTEKRKSPYTEDQTRRWFCSSYGASA